MADNTLPTRPVSEGESLLRSKFYESVAAQSDLMDKLGEKLLTVELAIPGIYAAALKLVRGEKATIGVSLALILAFTCWLAALILTLIALAPKKWQVDVSLLKQDLHRFSEGLGIEDYFERSATCKRRWLSASCVTFFAGVVCAVIAL